MTKKTEQVVETLRRMPSHQPLAIVIKRILALDFFPQAAKAAGINPVLLASVRRRCELMCKCLLEKVLQVLVSQNMLRWYNILLFLSHLLHCIASNKVTSSIIMLCGPWTCSVLLRRPDH